MLDEGVRALIADNAAPLTPNLSTSNTIKKRENFRIFSFIFLSIILDGRILVIQSETDGKYAYESETSNGLVIEE